MYFKHKNFVTKKVYMYTVQEICNVSFENNKENTFNIVFKGKCKIRFF